MPITDAQRALLRAALPREDSLLPRPDRLAGAALRRVEAALTNTGLAEPVPVDANQPRWRENAGMPTGLRITDAGRAAAGTEAVPVEDLAPDEVGPARDADVGASEPGDAALIEPAAPRPLRPGSKAARLIAMLSEAEGASVDALSTALAWQPHTVRAALTRLRQSGHAVTASKGTGQPTTYRIAPMSQTTPVPADAEAVD